MSLVPLHVVGGAITIVPGPIALYAFAGASLHRRSGTMFVKRVARASVGLPSPEAI
jgi:hypothetical protein